MFFCGGCGFVFVWFWWCFCGGGWRGGLWRGSYGCGGLIVSFFVEDFGWYGIVRVWILEG